jgi:predicted small lipoprotein YifL
MARRILALIFVAAPLAACGIRGPLYLPEEAPPPDAVSGAPEAPTGEAAEEEAGEDGDEAGR